MCGFNSGYHDVNVCYYGRTMVNFNKTINRLLLIEKNKFHHIKKEVVAIFTDVTDFDNEHKFTSASKLKLLLSTQCQMCISKRNNIYIIIAHIYTVYIYMCVCVCVCGRV